MFENRPWFLAGPEHHGVLRGDIGGDQELLQKELNLADEEAPCDSTGTVSKYREGDEDRCVRFGR
jgi:hypothetical protein